MCSIIRTYGVIIKSDRIMVQHLPPSSRIHTQHTTFFLLCNSLPSTPRHTSINTIHCHATWRLWYPPPSPTLVSFYQFYDMALTPPTPCLRRRCPPSSSLLDGNCIMRILTTVAFVMTTTTVFSLPNGDCDGVFLSSFPPPSPTEIC